MQSRFPVILKSLREQRKMTQQEMANMLNISQRGYGHYETGESEPSIDALITLSEFFNLPIDVLVGRYTMPGLSDTPQEERKKRIRGPNKRTIVKEDM